MAALPATSIPVAYPGPWVSRAAAPAVIPAAAPANYFPASGPVSFPVPANRNDSPLIAQALHLVGEIRHLPADEAYMRQLGINLAFRGGAEALALILNKNIRVEFGDMGDSPAHAEWVAEENLIRINQKYQNDPSRDNLYAISEAIYHEAGHAAKLGDGNTSLQEEIDCLALNTLANRFHAATDPDYARSVSRSRLIADGVALYTRLFFDTDPEKGALVNRVIQKYGELPPVSPDHPIPRLPYGVPITDRVLRELQARRVGWVG